MKIYRNLWAGNPTWFVETNHTRDRRNGFGFALCKDGICYQRHVSYFSSSIKEAPDRYPLVGEVTVEEMFDFIRSKCHDRGRVFSCNREQHCEQKVCDAVSRPIHSRVLRGKNK